MRSIALIGGVLGRAGQRGQQRRKEAAEKGEVLWDTPKDLLTYMQAENAHAIQKRKEVMGRMQQYQGLSEEETKKLHEKYGTAAPEEQSEVSEDAMLNILGATAGGDPTTTSPSPAAVASEQVLKVEDGASTGEVEAMLENMSTEELKETVELDKESSKKA